jgi:hypothetical protein
MKVENLPMAKLKCEELRQLKNHSREVNSIRQPDLPEDQDHEFREYQDRLTKRIKILEKEIAQL